MQYIVLRIILYDIARTIDVQHKSTQGVKSNNTFEHTKHFIFDTSEMSITGRQHSCV